MLHGNDGMLLHFRGNEVFAEVVQNFYNILFQTLHVVSVDFKNHLLVPMPHQRHQSEHVDFQRHCPGSKTVSHTVRHFVGQFSFFERLYPDVIAEVGGVELFAGLFGKHIITMRPVKCHVQALPDCLGIRGASVSILATPLDFRIYLEFGGWAKEDRKAYYRFLTSAEYDDFHSSIGRKPDMMVFDVDWYSARFNERPCAWWLDEREQSIGDAMVKLNETSNRPVTWNRMLHGYIVPRDSLKGDKTINMELIGPKLIDIIALYEVFVAFCSKEREKQHAA